MYSVFFQFRAEPAFRQNVVNALLADARASRRHEPGTIRMDVIEDEHRPNDLYVYAVYRDREAFDTHFTGPHFRRWQEDTDERWLASPVVVLGRGTILYPPDDDPVWSA